MQKALHTLRNNMEASIFSPRRKRRRKAGSTAIPFLITVLIAMFMFGGAAVYFYKKLTFKVTELQPMQSAVQGISKDDINTLLFVLEPEQEGRQTAVMMLRFDPTHKQEFCLAIPLDLIVEHEGRSMTVSACLSNHGIAALKTSLSKTLDQPIDRYVEMDHRGFQTVVNLIGNVNYRIPIKDEGLRPSSTVVLLDNNMFETLLTSSNYPNERERESTIAMSVAQLLNQCDGTRIAENLDEYFNQFCNAVSTDITAMDFQEHRHAIHYVFQYAQSPARSVLQNYDTTPEGLLTVNDTLLERLKVTFYQYDGEDAEGNKKD